MRYGRYEPHFNNCFHALQYASKEITYETEIKTLTDKLKDVRIHNPLAS